MEQWFYGRTIYYVLGSHFLKGFGVHVHVLSARGGEISGAVLKHPEREPFLDMAR